MELNLLSLDAWFIEYFLYDSFVSVCSPCAGELQKNICPGILFAGNVSYLDSFKFSSTCWTYCWRGSFLPWNSHVTWEATN